MQGSQRAHLRGQLLHPLLQHPALLLPLLRCSHRIRLQRAPLRIGRGTGPGQAPPGAQGGRQQPVAAAPTKPLHKLVLGPRLQHSKRLRRGHELLLERRRLLRQHSLFRQLLLERRRLLRQDLSPNLAARPRAILSLDRVHSRSRSRRASANVTAPPVVAPDHVPRFRQGSSALAHQQAEARQLLLLLPLASFRPVLQSRALCFPRRPLLHALPLELHPHPPHLCLHPRRRPHLPASLPLRPGPLARGHLLPQRHDLSLQFHHLGRADGGDIL